MAGETSVVAVPAPRLAESEAIPAQPPVELVTCIAPPTLSALASTGVAPSVMDALTLVLDAGGPAGLSRMGSDQALTVVEAVEVVKAWADSVSLDATAAMVRDGNQLCSSRARDPQRARVQTVPASLSFRGRPRDPGRDRPAHHDLPAPGVVRGL